MEDCWKGENVQRMKWSTSRRRRRGVNENGGSWRQVVWMSTVITNENLYIGWAHPVAHVTMNEYNKARWNIVANEGLLYSFTNENVVNLRGPLVSCFCDTTNLFCIVLDATSFYADVSAIKLCTDMADECIRKALIFLFRKCSLRFSAKTPAVTTEVACSFSLPGN
jgi:hypothetical protein